MANAGCINAYDCNGCLIQTLQNLDSACIGVGVQYTAPNPLDDKRLDYIKYTDKCGCVQCLSAENEILIYATNGVIKNLTLTNDDVNEAIKIKWNDIFGSNRVKTVVRYKTGSYPVSITDGTLAVEETTKNQYSSTPFSLSGVLDETTYYISAFAVDSNGTIIDVQSGVITTEFRIPGYSKLNWIESTGTQYIKTGITPTTSTRFKTKYRIISKLTEYDVLIGASSDSFGKRYYVGWRNSSGGNTNGVYLFTPTNNYNSTNVIFGSVGVDYQLQYMGSTLSDGTHSDNISYTSSPSKELYVFAENQNNSGPTGYSNSRLYYLQLYSGSTLVRDFVPAKRKSDNVIGLIDMLTKTFYTNSGTGTFNYG